MSLMACTYKLVHEGQNKYTQGHLSPTLTSASQALPHTVIVYSTLFPGSLG
jgi:hypothetical protein